MSKRKWSRRIVAIIIIIGVFGAGITIYRIFSEDRTVAIDLACTSDEAKLLAMQMLKNGINQAVVAGTLELEYDIDSFEFRNVIDKTESENSSTCSADVYATKNGELTAEYLQSININRSLDKEGGLLTFLSAI